jgi:hypothetical protein
MTRPPDRRPGLRPHRPLRALASLIGWTLLSAALLLALFALVGLLTIPTGR